MNKHRIKLFCIIVSFLAFFTGCQIDSKNRSYITENNFDMKSASSVAESYMNYLVKDDTDNIKKLYSKELLNTPTKNENKNLNIVGYNLANSSQVGKSGIFIMNVCRSSKEKSFASLDQYSIKIIKEGNNYKISETNNIIQREVFIYKNKIRLKNKNDANSNLVMSLRGLPNYIFSKDDKANIDKIQVPRRRFGMMNFSYNGNLLAITSVDTNTYIGIISIDDSLIVQGQSGGDQESGGGNEDTSQSQDDMETSIGKEITSIDILKNSKVNFMGFSKDEKFLALQYSNDSVNSCIRVYEVDGGDMVKYKFEENFPMDKVNVTFSSFDEDVLNFDVTAKSKQDDSINDIIGKWQLDFKEFKAIRM
ncbi:hypothetical protein KM800_10600 [Clostridium tyrobutyricum]|uniref:hypothetical protein n=1 Tax=Clostridium tyrobutyricum TaxID=1519 RepID=UPI001C3906D4|nr:hypothetical protein [Clostridium tyrobutyricum]MBV4419764.1 hypothetical protein [Clostridium tyrobutyricum]